MSNFEILKKVYKEFSVDLKKAKPVVKEGFVIPSPEGGEDESTFIARCNKEIYGEFPDDAQRNAVCYQKWNEK